MPYDKIFLAFFFRLINEAKKYFKKSILITLTKPAASSAKQVSHSRITA